MDFMKMGEPSCSRCRRAQSSFPGHIEIQMVSLSFNCKGNTKEMLCLNSVYVLAERVIRRSLRIWKWGLWCIRVCWWLLKVLVTMESRCRHPFTVNLLFSLPAGGGRDKILPKKEIHERLWILYSSQTPLKQLHFSLPSCSRDANVFCHDLLIFIDKINWLKNKPNN